jgi:hypothetical protein
MIVGVDFDAPKEAREQRKKIVAIAAHLTGLRSYLIEEPG